MIDINQVRSDVTAALKEDLQTGDVSAALLPDLLQVTATLMTREPMVLAGSPWVEMAFHEVDQSVVLDWHVAECAWIASPQILCTVTGKAKSIYRD